MKSVEFNYYTGPNHGWVKVPKDYLKSIISWIPSEYSFETERYFYLEEDCDATCFKRALSAIGVEMVCVEIAIKSESTIRSYKRCKVTP